MATISTKSIQKINDNCSNNFQFDIQAFVNRGDKNLSKTIHIDQKKLIKATLYYQDEVLNYQETGQKIPVLNVSVWIKSTESTIWSSGLGKFHYYKEKKVLRRNMTVLQEITKEITDDFINSLAVDNRDKGIFSL